MGRRVKNNKGITLIEVLVSIAILGVVTVPLFTLFITTARITNSSEDKLKAVAIAQKHMERIKAVETLGDVTEGTFTEGSYDVVITVNKVEDYRFLTGNSDEGTDTLSCDMRIVVDTDDTMKLYYDADTPPIYLTPELNLSYDGDRFTINNSLSFEPLSENNPKVIVELKGSRGIIIHGKNLSEEEETLSFYFIKAIESEAEYTLINEEGKIARYTNMVLTSGDESTDYDSRVYSVIIEVTKKGNVLQKLVGYKTFLK